MLLFQFETIAVSKKPLQGQNTFILIGKDTKAAKPVWEKVVITLPTFGTIEK
jgi:hypothetical protein